MRHLATVLAGLALSIGSAANAQQPAPAERMMEANHALSMSHLSAAEHATNVHHYAEAAGQLNRSGIHRQFELAWQNIKRARMYTTALQRSGVGGRHFEKMANDQAEALEHCDAIAVQLAAQVPNRRSIEKHAKEINEEMRDAEHERREMQEH